MARQWRAIVAAICVLAAGSGSTQAQEPFLGRPPTKPLFLPNNEMEGPGYGAVSFLDSPVPYSFFRLRYDVNNNLQRPERGENFWAKPGLNGPGPKFPETGVDYQDLDLYLEHAVAQRFSVFASIPLRRVQPDVNPDQTGLGDLRGGAKFAFILNPSLVMSAQVTGYVPTGNAVEGLGRHFYAVEPALLAEAPLHQWVTLNGQVSYFLPFDGSDFAGEVFRYGLGITVGDRKDPEWWITPVAEIQGWTFLSGKELVDQGGGIFVPRNAREETIINGYLGVRFHLSERCDIYTGYGHSLTNATWARDIYRFEFRFAY